MTDAQVLAALYNSSRFQGLGFLQAVPGPMTTDVALRLISGSRNEPGQPKAGAYFDYLFGRVIKTDVSKNPLDLRLYDRDMGPGAGRRAIEAAMDELKRPS
jgi:hypothetical protein